MAKIIKRIIKILLDKPSNNFVINGSSAPALMNWLITWGKTKTKRDIITMIEKPINING